MKNLISMLGVILTAIFSFNLNSVEAKFKLNINNQDFKNCSYEACQHLLKLFQDLEDFSSGDDGINIIITVLHDNDKLSGIGGNINIKADNIADSKVDDRVGNKADKKTKKQAENKSENFSPDAGWDFVETWHEEEYKESYKTAIQAIKDFLPMSDSAVENLIEDAELKRFLDAGALEWIDFISDFRDRDYFQEKELAFCREFPNSPSKYGFIDAKRLKQLIHECYGGGFVVNDNSSFTFRLSGTTVLWDNTMRSNVESAFFALKTLTPAKSNFNVLAMGLKLLQSMKAKNLTGENNNAVRFFFRTNQEGIYFAAVIREDAAPAYYLAANKPLIEKKALIKTLTDSERIRFDDSMGGVIFYLWNADKRLKLGTNLDTCLDIFIMQTLDKLLDSNLKK